MERMNALPYKHSQMLDQELSSSEEASSKVPATILVAEDDPAVRLFVNAVLEQAGHQVILAENGRKSLEICKTYPGLISVLVTDVVMPETNGRELAERAKLILPDLKVVFISGYVDRPLKEKDTDDPSYAFLEKPFSAQSLADSIARFCGVTASMPG
jgi:DNA-binding NtrC family response regulator